MATITNAPLAIAASPVIVLKGKGKAARELAYMQIAPYAMIETMSRADMIANLKAALGTNPTEVELKTAQSETTIGRVAARLPVSELPKGCTDEAQRLEYARDIVLHYAAPAQEGKQARKLRAGQKGRRSINQHKIVRAADEAWSLIKAELGLGTAQTLKARNDAKRSTNANAVRGDGKGKGKVAPAPAPAHAELVKPAAKMTSDEKHAYVVSQASTLLAFGNKNAATLDSAFGEAIQAFKRAIDKAASERELLKASVTK